MELTHLPASLGKRDPEYAGHKAPHSLQGRGFSALPPAGRFRHFYHIHSRRGPSPPHFSQVKKPFITVEPNSAQLARSSGRNPLRNRAMFFFSSLLLETYDRGFFSEVLLYKGFKIISFYFLIGWWWTQAAALWWKWQILLSLMDHALNAGALLSMGHTTMMLLSLSRIGLIWWLVVKLLQKLE